MNERIPGSLESLADDNEKKLNEYGLDRSELIGDFNKTQEAGNKYLEEIVASHYIDLAPDGKTAREGLKEVPESKRELVSEILKFDPALIIVRPEMFHLTNEVCGFLQHNGFNIEYVSEKKIPVEEYFEIYKEAIKNIEGIKPGLPSRTLTYTNAGSSIIIFTDQKKRFDEVGLNLADFFSEEYKGSEGIYQKGTLRGDIILNEALKLGFDKMTHPTIAKAIDPFGAYAEIIKQPEEYWYHKKTTPELYSLMYTAQGIHCPDSSELIKDIATLHTVDQLKDILSLLKHE